MSSRNQRRFAFSTLALLAAISTVEAFQASRLKIDGKLVPGQTLSVKGKTYIPLDALKAVGVGVRLNAGTVELTMPIKSANATDASQQEGVEGKLRDWLFNGVWRFRVISLEKAPASFGAGWEAKMEIQNGSNIKGYAPITTGWQGLTLVTGKGVSIDAASNAIQLSQEVLNQRDSNTQTVFFFPKSESKSMSIGKPVRIILRFDPKGVDNTPLHFSAPNPTFRVDVTGK